MKSENDSQTRAPARLPVTLTAILGQAVPSFKNRKRAILDKQTGHMRTLTEPETKQRMARLEKAIEFALYSWCQTGEQGTDLACRRQLRTALSGLLDDSLKEIPEFSFGVRYVEIGQEGVEITIEPFEKVRFSFKVAHYPEFSSPPQSESPRSPGSTSAVVSGSSPASD